MFNLKSMIKNQSMETKVLELIKFKVLDYENK